MINEPNSILVDTINQLKNKSNYSEKYLIGVLNSHLLSWYSYRFVFAKAIRTMQFDNPTTSRIPYPKLDFTNPSDVKKHDLMVQMVEDMLALHKQLHKEKSKSRKKIIQDDIDHLDKKIDALVYELYGLTDEEIGVVEEE